MYKSFNVDLTAGQAKKLARAISTSSPTTLKFTHDQLGSGSALLFTTTQINKLNRALINGTGAQIKFSQAAIRYMKKDGGILPILAAMAPLGVALLSGALGAVGTWGTNKILTKIDDDSSNKQKGGFGNQMGRLKNGGKLAPLGTPYGYGYNVDSYGGCVCGGCLDCIGRGVYQLGASIDNIPMRVGRGGKLFPLGVKDTR